MINKQVKSSERESNSYTITRATPIDLKTIDSEVALLSGRATQTPIDMQSLWNEIQNLKGSLGNSIKLDFGTISITDGITKSAGFKINSAIAIGYATKRSNSRRAITVNITNIIKSGQSGNSFVQWRPIGELDDPAGFSIQVSGNDLILKRPYVPNSTMGEITVIAFCF